jgi:nitrate reductase beta subunit
MKAGIYKKIYYNWSSKGKCPIYYGFTPKVELKLPTPPNDHYFIFIDQFNKNIK